MKKKGIQPLRICQTYEEITLTWLQQNSKTNLFIDVDNTLFIPKKSLAEQDTEQVVKFIQVLQVNDIGIVAISNNFSVDRKKFFDDLLVPTIFFAKKPLSIGFKKALRLLDLDKNDKGKIIHVGDQFLTDGVGAFLFGIDYVLVRPIRTDSDLIYAKPSRIIEKILGVYKLEGRK
ncbi:MAG: YqeG family HAD IIIA-type phosphatase [Culicoidibacterales bacterium]